MRRCQSAEMEIADTEEAIDISRLTNEIVRPSS